LRAQPLVVQTSLQAVQTIPVSVPGGVYLTELQSYELSPDGTLSMWGPYNIHLGQTSDGDGIWRLAGGSLSEIARESQAAPGLPGYLYSNLGGGQANGSSDFYFVGAAHFPNRDSIGALWREHSGQTSLLLKNGDIAPGLDGTTLVEASTLGAGPVDALGRTFVSTHLSGPTINPQQNDTITYWYDGSVFHPAVRNGDTVPGLSGHADIWSILSPRSGSASFITIANASRIYAIYSYDGTGLSSIALNNSPAPGIPGSNITNPRGGLVSAGGTLLFQSGLTGGTSANNSALWRRVNGLVTLAARKGQSLTSPAGWTMRGTDQNAIEVLQPLAVNDAGTTVFLSAAGLGGDQKRALLVSDAGGVRSLVRDQDAWPGGGGVFGFYPTVPIAQVNSSGTLAFETNGGVFGYDPSLGLLRVAAPGDMLQVAPGDLRTVLSASLGIPCDSANGTCSGLLDSGDLYFYAAFNNNTSAIMRMTIPVPATGVMFGAVGLLTLGARRRT
jgi:hypothetical protein